MSSNEPIATPPDHDASPPAPPGGSADAARPAVAAAPESPQATSSGDHAQEDTRGDSAGDDADTHEEGGPEEAQGTAADGGAPGAPKKRRRRRRKKGGALGAAGQPAAEGEVPAADAAAGDAPPGDDAGKPHDERAKVKGKKHERRDHGHDKQRLLRERPAFGLGDVVFGKILEITDEAVFVDLSGKARGIFDRREMLLPEESADDPVPPHVDEEDDRETDEHAEHAEGTSPDTDTTEATPAEASATDSPVADAPVDAKAVGAEPTPAEALAEAAREGERRVAGRRIIVAAAVKNAETAAPPPADAHADTAPEGVPAASASDEEPVATQAETHAHRPAPYAPPIVLELGAHFVGLVHNDGARGGLIVLTRHPRRVTAAKIATSTAFRDKSLISGLVTGVVRGGVEVDIDGLRAFAPGSHLDLRLGVDFRPLIGRRLEFLVTQYGKRGRDVVLSRRPMLEAEAKANRAEALERVQVGAIVPGVVKSVVSFGAFLDIGGVEGLVTLQEMSHNRSDGPHDVFRPGETVDVRIIRMDEKGKIWLSRKSAIPDPWDDAMKKYAPGSRHTGKVVRLQPFGAFVELEPGIDGLIHVGDLSIKPIEHPSEVVKVGDPIDVVVAQADPVSHKIGLHPAPTGALADETPQRVQMHKPVKVQVMAVEPGGLVVRILGATGRNARGYITSMATGTPRGTELRKPFPVGMQLDAKVIEMDPRRGEIKLSIKALHDDTERNAYQQYRQQVTREAKFGTLGDLLAKKDAPK